MIEINDAFKVFNKGKANQIKAIDHTSLTFDAKGMVAILGASGSGKTTLLNVIGGLDKPTKGKIYVNGKLINGKSSSRTDSIRNAEIGYIFQNYHLLDSMTVAENVAITLKLIGVTNKAEQTRRINYVLDKVGLYRYRNRPVDTLSGGERQRVGIARALVKNPAVIIADEPTGNLDSKNSLNIMNIIKAISRDKLVILVTHEKTLANFFADRIIDVVDGKVVGDRLNAHDGDLDYRIDNKIYLQDFPTRACADVAGMKIDLVSDMETNTAPLQVRMVVKGGNLLIQCEGMKVDVVDSSSAIELVDDHYKKITQHEADEYTFNYEEIAHKKPVRYHHLFNPWNALIAGFKTIAKFSVIKKILLVGFVIASAFVLYSYSSILGISTITDDEFTTTHRSYVSVRTVQNTVEEVEKYEKLAGVTYVMPGDASVAFTMDMSDVVYQFANVDLTITGSFARADLMGEDAIIYGRAVKADGEIVIDRQIIDELADGYESVMVGLEDPQGFVGRKVTLAGYDDKTFTIVGICDELTPCIYIHKDDMETVLRATVSYIGLEESENPEADGTDTTDEESYNKWLTHTGGLIISCFDPDALAETLQKQGVNAKCVYSADKDSYEDEVSATIATTVIAAIVILVIGLLEIYLILRSSFLSRIREVGTLRAIGVKKTDIYTMFIGEIVAITLLTSIIGFYCSGGLVNLLLEFDFFKQMYVLDIRVILLSIVTVFGFNLLAGLLPVWLTLRKTPAAILARTDID